MDLPNVPNENELDLQMARENERYKQAVRTIMTTMGVCMLLLIGAVIWLAVVVAGNTSQNEHQIAVNQAASDHRWCSTFDLLAGEKVPAPPDPAANPSRESSYKLYQDFVTLKSEFNCNP